MSKKRAFITGGSSGIGLSIIDRLREKGWDILAPSHDELDLSNLDNVASFAASLKDRQITAFIHVAGVWHETETVLADMSLVEFNTDQIIKTMNVGVTAAMLLTRTLVGDSRFKTVIGITGTFSEGAKGWVPYYTSKRALEDFLVGLSQDGSNLNVYGISPADTDTPAFEKFYPGYVNEAQSPNYIGELTADLLEGKTNYQTGSIIQLRSGEAGKGFHV